MRDEALDLGLPREHPTTFAPVRTTAFDTYELALEPRTALPQLRVIVTPPEMRARWETWVRIRASIALTIALTLMLVAVIGLA